MALSASTALLIATSLILFCSRKTYCILPQYLLSESYSRETIIATYFNLGLTFSELRPNKNRKFPGFQNSCRINFFYFLNIDRSAPWAEPKWLVCCASCAAEKKKKIKKNRNLIPHLHLQQLLMRNREFVFFLFRLFICQIHSVFWVNEPNN